MSSKSQSTGSTDNNQPTPTAHKSGMDRRGFMRKFGVGAASAAAVSGGAVRLDHGPVGNSQAIAPAVIAGGAGASLAVGWALREFEVLGSDSPSEGLTPEAFEMQVHNTVRARKSNNKSTFIDNENIVDGLKNSVFADAKIAAIDQINNQNTQGEVENAALAEKDEQFSSVLKNLIRSWDETLSEYDSIQQAAEEHEDVGRVLERIDHNGNYPSLYADDHSTYTLPNGDEIEHRRLRWPAANDDTYYGDFSGTSSSSLEGAQTNLDDYDRTEYIVLDEWENIYEKITDAEQELHDEIITWVDGVYSEVQEGAIEPEELLTPRELAELTAEEEDYPQAISDLMALNVSVDLEREAEIFFEDVEATAYGQISYTGDTQLETGSVNPNATDSDGDDIYPGSFYFTYDVSQGEGTWSAYQDGVDGGTTTFTSEPFDETVYYIHTEADETAEVTADDFTEESGDWTVDLSGQLDNGITNITQVEYYSLVEETQYETIQLTDSFEIVTFRDSSGSEYDESNFERTEPQTDDNYITQEEWEEQQQRHEELIEKYEDAQGGGAISIGSTSIPNELIGLGLAVAAAIGLLR